MTADVRVIARERLAVDIADQWVRRLRSTPALRMGLTAAASCLPLYTEISRRDVSWDESEVLLLDEWTGLPPGDPGARDTTLRRTLLDHVDLPEDSYRRIDADADDLAAECAAVDTWLDSGLHLVVLDLGGNGELGRNQPGTASRTRTHGSRLGAVDGVTVGVADLLAAHEVWVVATGGRAEIVRTCLEGPVTDEVPGSLLQQHPRCTWWVDAAAGRRT